MRKEIIDLWHEFQEYTEELEPVQKYYREAVDFQSLPRFMEWLENGFIKWNN